MKGAELYRKIEEKIAECGEKYERDKDDSFLSHIRNSELETLKYLYDRVRGEELSETFIAGLKNRLCELEEERAREDACPSFSWYGEHYHYLILDGKCDAYQCMIKLLQEENESFTQ